MGIGTVTRNAPVLAASMVVFALGSNVSAARADSPSNEKIDLHGVVGLDDSAQGFGDSFGFEPSAVTGSNDPLMSPNLLPFNSGNGGDLPPSAVPLPWSGGMGAVGLMTLAMRRRRRSVSM